jgi:hypothetical protein
MQCSKNQHFADWRLASANAASDAGRPVQIFVKYLRRTLTH